MRQGRAVHVTLRIAVKRTGQQGHTGGCVLVLPLRRYMNWFEAWLCGFGMLAPLSNLISAIEAPVDSSRHKHLLVHPGQRSGPPRHLGRVNEDLIQSWRALRHKLANGMTVLHGAFSEK